MKESLGIVCLLLAGCSGVPYCDHSSLRAEYEHVSHPTAGHPFAGPEYEEDWLDQANLIGRCRNGRAYVEMGLGYKLTDGGFYGPDLTFTGRVGYLISGQE